MRLKHCMRDATKCNKINNLVDILQPYVNLAHKRALCNNDKRLDKILEQFTPTVHLVSNDQSGGKKRASHASTSGHGSNSSSNSSENDLGEVLNSIENKLGLAAIENGQHQVGINMLKYVFN